MYFVRSECERAWDETVRNGTRNRDGRRVSLRNRILEDQQVSVQILLFIFRKLLEGIILYCFIVDMFTKTLLDSLAFIKLL